jgi:hypothetical protein
MSRQKLNQLFQAAQRVAPPAASATLAENVARALRQEPLEARPAPASLFEELNAWFPRLALLTLVVLAVGVAVNLALGASDPADLGAGLTQISAPWWLVPGEY